MNDLTFEQENQLEEEAREKAHEAEEKATDEALKSIDIAHEPVCSECGSNHMVEEALEGEYLCPDCYNEVRHI